MFIWLFDCDAENQTHDLPYASQTLSPSLSFCNILKAE